MKKLLLEELQDYYGVSFPREAFLTLISAIPDDIVNLVLQVTLLPGTFWATSVGLDHLIAKIIDIEPEEPTVVAWKLHPDNTVSHLGLLSLDITSNLRPATFDPSLPSLI